jgi:hypothetical protein
VSCISIALVTAAVLGQVPASDRVANMDRDASGREHWAFQSVQRPAVPHVSDAGWVRNPIDNFVLARLEALGWRPASPPEPRALLRRMYFDLTGLPPTPEEQTLFAQELSRPPDMQTPDARRIANDSLDRVVDQLLTRPTYGERWARHWLDLVRYADSNGYEVDADKAYVWRYRDWVIRSFNDDKPFDRFILEQLAGDELPDASAETLVATGYYRLGPWDQEPADPKEDRFDQLDDIVSTTSQLFLGLSMGCARCHDHKFEPLTMLDYYRLLAVFDPLKRPEKGSTGFDHAELDLPIGSPAELAAQVERDRQVADLEDQIARARNAFREEFLAAGRSKLAPEALAALAKDRSRRTDEEKNLAAKFEKQLEEELVAAVPPEVREWIAGWERAKAALREGTPDLPRGYFLHEPSPLPSQTHLLLRGKAAQPGPEVAPGLPAVLVAAQPPFLTPSPRTSQRRLTLARWVASKDNPLTARVLVNRVWHYHFGEGLVRTPSDFGVQGDRPTHLELLDWLAAWFVDEGWSLKKLHRLIMTSNTYRMSKAWDSRYGTEDPEDRRLWRVPSKRLEAEAIRDAMLSVAGNLNPSMYGPAVYPSVSPEALAGHSDTGKAWPTSNDEQASRRTIYVFVKRSLIVPMIEVLDFCDSNRSAPRRMVTSVAPQALSLFNGEFVNRQAQHLAARLVREAGDDVQLQIERAFLLTLCRPPTPAERASLTRFLHDEAARLMTEPASPAESPTPETARQRALEQMCRVIFNLNEFVYTD